jgi:xylulokinase
MTMRRETLDALLGIDVGTSNIKVAAYSREGRLLAQSSRPTPTVPQGLRRASRDPETLWQETAATIREVAGRIEQAQVAGLSIASIGEAGVPLDAQGDALYPIVAWYDERTVPQADWWSRTMGEAETYRHTGLPLGHTFTLQKLLWLRETEPDVYRRMVKWLCVSDYMAYRLTGEQSMGYSLASRTMALDLRSRRWSVEMLSHAGVSADCLPALQPEGSLVGQVTADAARQTGLRQGTPVYVGGHDHVCGALAMGVCRPGIVLDSTGTTEAELTTLESVEGHLQRANLAFCLGCHVARDRYYAIGSILGAGSTVGWLASLLWPAQEQGRDQALQALTQAAADSPPGAKGLYLLPYMAGAGSPDRNPTARGVLAGLSLEHTRADLARAVIEGLAFELRLLWEALEDFSEQPLTRVVSVGGGTRNALWNQVKADITGRALEIPEQAEAVTLGAAMLAGLGAGVYGDEQDAWRTVQLPFRSVQPDPRMVARYADLYALIRERLRPPGVELGRASGAAAHEASAASE